MKEVEIPEIEGFYRLSKNDFTPACEMLGISFSEDPIWTQILSDLPGKFPFLYAIPLKYALRYGVIYASSIKLEGIAVWLDSSKVEMSIWRLIRSGVISSLFRLGLKAAFRMRKTFAQSLKDRIANINPPYIYLLALGVDPKSQGKGIGSDMVSKMIDALPTNVPIYLETETKRNVGFYEKLGFTVIKKIMVPPYNLPMWEMIHPGKQ